MKHKALVVDDEKIILNGVIALPIWKSLSIEVTGAKSGEDALRYMEQTPVDILVSDIKMSGMDGLSLVEVAKANLPNLQCIILSGYSMFEYAQTSIRLGVRRYLLKPVSEIEFNDIIEEIVLEIEENRAKQKSKVVDRAHPVDTQSSDVIDYLMKLKKHGSTPPIRLQNQKISMLLISMKSTYGIDEKSYWISTIMHTVRHMFPEGQIEIVTMMGHILILGLNRSLDEVIELLKEKYEEPIGLIIYRLCSDAPLGEIYNEAIFWDKYNFYDSYFMVVDRFVSHVPFVARTELFRAVETEDYIRAREELHVFFEQILLQKREPSEANSICEKCYLKLHRLCLKGESGISILEGQRFPLSHWERIIYHILDMLEVSSAEKRFSQYGKIVRKAMEYTIANIASEELSISYMAENILYINPDYFGKLFRKETGIHYTRYVIDLRMEKIQDEITHTPWIKTKDLAEKTGFGGNSQYMRKVFKEKRGYSIDEYRSLING